MKLEELRQGIFDILGDDDLVDSIIDEFKQYLPEEALIREKIIDYLYGNLEAPGFLVWLKENLLIK